MKEEIKEFFKGEVEDSEETLKKYSRDTSLFEVRPKLVVFPKDSEDLENLVKYAGNKKQSDPSVSLAMRAAGSDMTGGPLNESIIADTTRYMNHFNIDPKAQTAAAEPGVLYKNFELETSNFELILPCYPASKELAALGGMVANNCAGEKTLRYGKMEDYVLETKVIFSDGNEYTVRSLSHAELMQKVAEDTFEGNLYKGIYNLLEDNKQIIREAKPKVSKNSAGYYLWNVQHRVLDKEEEMFDLNKLIVGSQGTLGIITEAKIRLVREKKHHDMVSLFFKSWDDMPEVVRAILPYEPESLETFDDATLKLGLRFMPEVARRAGSGFLAFAKEFLPEVIIGAQMLGLPKLVVLVEVAEDTEEEVKEKVRKIVESIDGPNPHTYFAIAQFFNKLFFSALTLVARVAFRRCVRLEHKNNCKVGVGAKVWHRVIEKDSEEEKYWVMRRESFNLLREHVPARLFGGGGDKKTAPFIEDFCIETDKIPEFLPKALQILEDADIEVNIAGHAGNGNFHIIPLMDLKDEKERKKIIAVADKFYALVGEYGGSITAEHNDGILRTPYLGTMYSPEVLELFRKTKEIFDPQNIFNPGKKVPIETIGTKKYLEENIAPE